MIMQTFLHHGGVFNRDATLSATRSVPGLCCTSLQASRVRSFLPTVPDLHFMETRRITNLNELEELDVDR